jgi:hypothetical protein
MKTKTILTFTILAIIFLGGVLSYGFERIKMENESASALENQSDAANAANSLARTTRADRDKASADLSYLDQITLTQSEIVPFIELMESTARQMGLKIKISSVNADPAPKTSSTTVSTYIPPQAVHISLSTDGPWLASLGFLHALENLPQKVVLDKADLDFIPPILQQGATTTPTATVSNWHGSFSLTTYIFQLK